MKEFTGIIGYSGIFISLIASVFVLLKVKTRIDTNIKYIIFFSYVASIVQLVQAYFTHNKIPNHFLHNFYIPFEFFCFVAYFHYGKRIKHSKYLFLLVFLCAGLSIYGLINHQSIAITIAYSIEAFTLFFILLLTTYKFYTEAPENYELIFNMGFMVVLLGLVCIMAFFISLYVPVFLYVSLNFIKYVIFGWALWAYYKLKLT